MKKLLIIGAAVAAIGIYFATRKTDDDADDLPQTNPGTSTPGTATPTNPTSPTNPVNPANPSPSTGQKIADGTDVLSVSGIKEASIFMVGNALLFNGAAPYERYEEFGGKLRFKSKLTGIDGGIAGAVVGVFQGQVLTRRSKSLGHTIYYLTPVANLKKSAL